ncbi:MAG: hypothetical protein U5M50_11115 [Sphingobium sp.]|nr:hypothetical protein [Sphingobium sp.]
MPLVTARRADSAGKRGGRERHIPSPANFVNHDNDKDKGSDWRAQLLMERYHVSPNFGDLILSVHFGEARHV